MDTQQYIDSGIIERYVLGLASEQEVKEVECMSSIYPEIKEELTSAQRSFESYASSISIAPPAELKSSILSKVKNTPQENTSHSNLKVVKSTSRKSNSSSLYKLSIAASVIVILGIGFLVFKLAASNSTLSTQVNTLQAENKEQESLLNDQLHTLESEIAKNNEVKSLVLNSSTKEIVLAGTEVSPQSRVRIYYNSTDAKAVFVQDYLPTPDASKQYQLWAIADGKPVDLGVIEKDGSTSEQAISISPKEVQAFAITLEKEGGSPTPTLDQMYVMGATEE